MSNAAIGGLYTVRLTVEGMKALRWTAMENDHRTGLAGP